MLVDVVALDQDGAALEDLRSIAEAGSGEVISADNAALAEAFGAEADVLATQVLVTAELPASVQAEQAQIQVSLPSSEGDLSISAFATVRGPVAPSVAPVERAWTPPGWALYAGVGAFGLGLVALLALRGPPAGPAGHAERAADGVRRRDGRRTRRGHRRRCR